MQRRGSSRQPLDLKQIRRLLALIGITEYLVDPRITRSLLFSCRFLGMLAMEATNVARSEISPDEKKNLWWFLTKVIRKKPTKLAACIRNA